MMNMSTAFQAKASIRSQEANWAVPINRAPAVNVGQRVESGKSSSDVVMNFEAYQVLRLTGMSDKDAKTAALAMQATSSASGSTAVTIGTGGSASGRNLQIRASSIAVEISQTSLQTGNGGLAVNSSTVRLEWNSVEGRLTTVPQQADPLVLDLTGEGLRFTGADKGKMFDIRGDGTLLMTSWIEGDNAAFLALDRNGNGAIDSGKELFGDQHGAADGFAELAKFDGNQDGAITADDDVFHMLLLMSPDGKTQGLEQAGITQLHLSGIVAKPVQYEGAHETAQSSFTRANGSQGKVHDVWLDVQA